MNRDTAPAFPHDCELIIHFAHPTYRLAEALAARQTGIAHFQTWSREETERRLGEADVLVLSGYWRNDWMEQLGRLRFIQTCSAGYDHFDTAALAGRGIRLANASGVNVDAVSEHAMAMVLAFTRLMHQARDNQARAHWRGMISEIGRREDELRGKTMLIIGMGQIGSRLAQLARAFGVTVIAIKRNLATGGQVADELHGMATLPELLPRADIVVLTCPLTAETRGIIDAVALSRMRRGAYLINVARGACVVEPALIEALESGRIAGAGLDVTDPEPLPASSALWMLPNVIITPHTAGETRRYEENVIGILIENLGRLRSGKQELRNQII